MNGLEMRMTPHYRQRDVGNISLPISHVKAHAIFLNGKKDVVAAPSLYKRANVLSM